MKRKQKWISSVLVSSILVSGATPVLAESNQMNERNVKVPISTAALEAAMSEAKVSKEEAVTIAKKAVNIPSGFTQEDISFDSNWMFNTEVWRISWRKNTEGHHEISVTVDANSKEVIGLNIWSDTLDEDITFPPKVNYDQAVEIGKAYIEKLYPNKLGNLELDQQTKLRSIKQPFRTMGYHDIQFYQMKNGVPFKNNSINLTVTGNGDVRNFNYNWINNVIFEDPADVFAKEKALEIVQKDIDLELRYQFDYYNRNNSEKDVSLAYVPRLQDYRGYYGNFSGQLDAQTGSWIDHQGKEINRDVTISDKPVANEATPLKGRDKELSKEEAYEIAKSLMDLPDDVVLQNARYHDNYNRNDESKVWSFDWRKKDQSYPFYMNAEIDAKTGELIRFNHDHHMYYPGNDEKDFDINISKKVAEEIATKMVKDFAPNIVDQLYFTSVSEQYYNNDEKPRFYNVYFVRKQDGIPVEGQGVSFTISTETGDVTSFSKEWSNLKFQPVKNLIAKEKAEEIFFNDLQLNLNYFVPYLYENDGKKKEAQVVYIPELITPEPIYLDASTGTWVSKETGKTINKETEVTDIEGHWAEESIITMIDYGFIEAEDTKIFPEKTLTKAETIKLLVKVLGYDSYYFDQNAQSPFEDVSIDDEFYPFILRAVEMGLIKSDNKLFNPEQSVTREELAVLIIKALGYDKLASIDGAFSSDFKDNSKIKSKGHVALIQKLGIMKGSTTGYFKPDETISKAEAIVTMIRFLEQKANLTERRYY